jgi:hypothetical protein
MKAAHGGGGVMPEPTSLVLARIARDLESLRNEATAAGPKLAMLAYLIDLALLEARERQGAASGANE